VVPVGNLNAKEAQQQSVPQLSEPETGARPFCASSWKGLAWLGFLVAVSLTIFQRLEHYLFPQFHSAQHQEINVVLGTIAAVVGAYYSTRRLNRAFSLQAQAEKKLALERNVLRTVTDNIPDSIFAKDLDGRYLFMNKAFLTLHGAKSPEDLLGRNVFDLFPKDQATAFHADDLQVMRAAGTPVESERRAVDPDGNVKLLQTTKVALLDKNGKIVGVVGLHRDVTRRNEAERRLRQSEANLAAAQRIAHFGSVEMDVGTATDPEKSPVRWSDEVYRIYGYEPGEVQESRENFLYRILHPGDLERVRKVVNHALVKAEPYAIDFRIVRPDGSERNIHARGDIILDPKTQAPWKMVGSVQDVTERVQAEIRLHIANQELAEKVQELEQRSKEINILSGMGSHLQSCKEAGEAYGEISTAAEQLFPDWSGALCMTTTSRTAVETVAEWGKLADGERVFAPDDCWALRRGQPQSFRRGEKIVPCRHIDFAEVSESLCVPLMAQGEALGILSLQRRQGQEQQAFTSRSSGEAQHRLAAVLAEQVGLALGNLRLRESLHSQSICDSLTGLFNRRHMEESLEREFSRAQRNKSSVAIIMIDLDQFKKFNDTFGHQAGDALLHTLGESLKKSTRGQDIACRYGGEEFALVLTDTSLSGATHRAEILRREVKQLQVAYAGQLLGAVSISIGIAMFPDHGATVTDVLRAADQALYCAKREGRDCISVSAALPVV
jgi:diguanylate cyclase (GGDEF)-like protein/PAS domain S-box-containing protein